MKRTPLVRRTPLQSRTPLKSSTSLKSGKPLERGTSVLSRAGIKRAKRKVRAGHDNTMLAACRGQRCYLAIPGVCCGDTTTVVPCHANWADYGKGTGIKARDEFTVPGCRACHYELDFGKLFSKDEKRLIWEAAYAAWEPIRTKKLYDRVARVAPQKEMATSTGLQPLGGHANN